MSYIVELKICLSSKSVYLSKLKVQSPVVERKEKTFIMAWCVGAPSTHKVKQKYIRRGQPGLHTGALNQRGGKTKTNKQTALFYFQTEGTSDHKYFS